MRDGYRTVLARAQATHPNAKIDGVLVQAMARRGREIILGISRDPDFGPMLMVGLGGIHVEVLQEEAEVDRVALVGGRGYQEHVVANVSQQLAEGVPSRLAGRR